MAVKCVENRHDAPMWDTDVICSQHLAQGGPATVQIYTKTGLWGAFPNKPAREGPPAYKSIPKLASGRHFPAGGPGRARQRTNLYQNWPPEGISQQVAQGSPATVQIYTKSGLWGAFSSKWPRGCPPAHFIYNNCKYIQLFKNRWTILKERRINTICKFWFEN